ncbi:uncharacterized protein LOC141850001 [Brevipalpus obovatus]|uniref:uncharacterized protein LOC141850001 n=1 Tax=Brevipalpus obovatus TaxID=246614 RepID=UPI003D9EE2FE
MKQFFVCFSSLIIFAISAQARRELVTQINPGCDRQPICENRKDLNMVLSTSTSGEDSLNFMTSTISNQNIKYPGFLVSLGPKIPIDWRLLLAEKCRNAYKLPQSPTNSIGMVVSDWPLSKEGDWTWDLSIFDCGPRNCRTEYTGNKGSDPVIKIRTHTSTHDMDDLVDVNINPESILIEIDVVNVTKKQLTSSKFVFNLYTSMTIASLTDYREKIGSTGIVFGEPLSIFSFSYLMALKNVSINRGEGIIESVSIGNLSQAELNIKEPSKPIEFNLPLECYFKTLNSFNIYELSIPLNGLLDEEESEDTFYENVFWKMAIGLRNTHFYDTRGSKNKSSTLMICFGVGIAIILATLVLGFLYMRKYRK